MEDIFAVISEVEEMLEVTAESGNSNISSLITATLKISVIEGKDRMEHVRGAILCQCLHLLNDGSKSKNYFANISIITILIRESSI